MLAISYQRCKALVTLRQISKKIFSVFWVALVAGYSAANYDEKVGCGKACRKGATLQPSGSIQEVTLLGHWSSLSAYDKCVVSLAVFLPALY